MHINEQVSKRESEHMRGRVGTATATGPALLQVAPIMAATTASPAMAAAAGMAAVLVTARMATVVTEGTAVAVTVGRVSEKEVRCT